MTTQTGKPRLIRFGRRLTVLVWSVSLLASLPFIGPASVLAQPPEELGSLIVLKTDEEANPLEGAEYTVESVAGTLTSDDEGVFCVDGLSLEVTFTVTETKAPDGYDLAEPAFQDVPIVSTEDCGTRLDGSWTADATFENQLSEEPPEELGSVVVYKTDAETDELVAEAVFTIAIAGGDPEEMDEVEDGIHCADGLPFDDYKVTEAEPPDGYEPASPDFQWFTVVSESSCDDEGRLNAADLTFTNAPSDEEEETLGDIEVVKVDQDEEPLEGAEFNLYLDDGDGIFDPAEGDALVDETQTADGDVRIDTQMTDGDGVAAFGELEPGTYWLEESIVPEGCEAETDVTEVELTAEELLVGEPIEMVVENTCEEQDVEGSTPSPTLGRVPDTATGVAAAGWMPVLMSLMLLGSLGAFATLNVRSVRSRRRP